MNTRWIMSISLITVFLIGLADYTKKADAYCYSVYKGKVIKWPSKKIRWRAGKNSFPSGHSRRTALTSANNRWNQAPGAFTFQSPTWGDSSVGRDNDENNIWFSTNQDILDGAPAMCLYWYNGKSEIIEADAIFDNDVLWSTATTYQFTKTAYGGDYRPFITTCLHEEGHAQGLCHVNYTYNIMGSDTTHIMTNNRKIRYYVGEDAGVGSRFLYGPTNNTKKNDIGVTHWKYDSASGEYSKHKLTKIFNKFGTGVINSNSFQGVRRYKVWQTQQYQVQFTYENNGRYTLNNIKVGYYISTNDKITTSDQLIAARTFNLAPNQVYTKKILVTIPNNLVIGQTYWLGVILDRTKSITEFSEFNNATHIPIEIIPPN